MFPMYIRQGIHKVIFSFITNILIQIFGKWMTNDTLFVSFTVTILLSTFWFPSSSQTCSPTLLSCPPFFLHKSQKHGVRDSLWIGSNRLNWRIIMMTSEVVTRVKKWSRGIDTEKRVTVTSRRVILTWYKGVRLLHWKTPVSPVTRSFRNLTCTCKSKRRFGYSFC